MRLGVLWMWPSGVLLACQPVLVQVRLVILHERVHVQEDVVFSTIALHRHGYKLADVMSREQEFRVRMKGGFKNRISAISIIGGF